MIGKVRGMLATAQGRDTLVTFLTEGLSMLGMVLVFRLAKESGAADFDRYVIVRRTVAFAFPVVLMGTMVGLTRFIAMSRDDTSRRRYLLGALSWVVPLGLLACLGGFLAPGWISWTCFGSRSEIPLALPMAVMTFGIALHGVSYGYLRGSGQVMRANAIQLLALGIWPCLAFVMMPDLSSVMWFTGMAWLITSIVAILPSLLAGAAGPIRRERAEIVRYGLPRVPGDIALGALLTVPVYIVVRTFPGLAADHAFGCTLLNLAAAVFSPVALLLLPAASAELGSGSYAGLEVRIARMTRIVLLASGALVLGFELLAEPFLTLYLGHAEPALVSTCRLIFLAGLPFAFFNGMRSVLDAYYQTPRNGVNLVVALALLLLGGLFHLAIATPWYTMGIAMLLALGYLGWATWRDTRYVRSELLRLATRGHGGTSVLVVMPDGPDGLWSKETRAQAEAMAAHGAQISYFHLERRTSPLHLLASRRRFKRQLRATRPDVVHVYFGSVAALWTVLASPLPVVVTFMGDALERSATPGTVRARLGGLFSQMAAFFAAGIICADTQVRDHLWWRTSEAHVMGDGPMDREVQGVLAHLRAVALHQPVEP
jgi:O-antigen/teichoic acid export membrane protein